MGLKPRQVGLSLEDFEDFPEEQKPAFEKMVLLLNPFIADTAGAISGRLTIGDNVAASYKTMRCRIPENAYIEIPNSSLQNGWVAYGTPYNTPGYRITMDGLVYLTGVIKSGTTGTGTLLFTLPEGYRPSATKIFTLAKSGGAGVWEAEIASNGECRVGIRNADATWSSLDNITFTAKGKVAAIPAFSGTDWPLLYETGLATQPAAVFVAKVQDLEGTTVTSFGLGGVDWEMADNNRVKVKQVHGLSPGRTYYITFLTLGV